MTNRLSRLGTMLAVVLLLTACGGDELVPTSGAGAVDPLATAVAQPADGSPPRPTPSGPVAEAPPAEILTPVAGFQPDQTVPGVGTTYARVAGELPALVLSFRETGPGTVIDDDLLTGLLNQIPLQDVSAQAGEPASLGGLEGRVITASATIASGAAADLRAYGLPDATGTWSLLLIAPAGDATAMADLVSLAETFAPTAGG